MTERRFRVDGALVENARVVLSTAAAKHARVLRLDVGATVRLFDGEGGEADARIASVEGGIAVDVLAVRRASERWHVVLVVGMPKAAVLEPLLRGATEAGASEIRLFEASRSVAHAEGDRAARKLERWSRIVEEAARQSERARVPPLSLHRSLADALASRPSQASLVGLDARRGEDLRAALGRAAEARMIVLGPEGGLSDTELDEIVALGGAIGRAALPVMRVETAAVVATALAVLAHDP